MASKPDEAETNRERLSRIAHEAIDREYGESWEDHRYSKFKDELGNWVEGQSQDSHQVCPWPNIHHVIDVIIEAVVEESQTNESSTP